MATTGDEALERAQAKITAMQQVLDVMKQLPKEKRLPVLAAASIHLGLYDLAREILGRLRDP